MVHFRKRLDKETLNKINELIYRGKQTKDPDEPGCPPHPGGTPPEQDSKPAEPINKGKLLLDATCAPRLISAIQQICFY